MNKTPLLTLILALAAGAAQAQSSPTEKGSGHAPGGLWGKKYTPGWAMMTHKERQAHMEKIEAVKGRDECRALIAEVQQQMTERAKGRGAPAPAKPAGDACGKLPAA